MKKLLSLFVGFILLFSVAFTFVGCNDEGISTYEARITELEKKIEELESQFSSPGVDEEDFVEVYSVTYANFSKEIAITSDVDIIYSDPVFIEKEEYESLKKLKRYNLSNKKRYIEESEAKKGDVLGRAYLFDGDYYYYKVQVEDIIYNIVKIKVLSDREILLKTNDSTERITSSYIHIVYFTV